METEKMARRVRELLEYCPESGELFWRVDRGGKARAGDVAGYFNKAGYRIVYINDRRYQAHRLIWLMAHGVWPVGQIDPVNGDRADNRLVNLREATHQQNAQNRGSHGALGVKGVCAVKGKFHAQITHNKKTYSLGRYRTIEEAKAVYDGLARLVHGEFFNPG